jgi:N-acetylmuramoyl-L-alanine amidase
MPMSRPSNYWKCIAVLGGIWVHSITSCPIAWAEPVIMGLRHWSSPTSARVVLDLSEEVAFKTFPLFLPPRVVTDIHGISVSKAPEVIRISSPLVDRIRLARHSPEVVRLVLDLKETGLEHESFLLPPMYGYPFRLVIDVKSPEMARRMKEARHAVQKEKRGGAFVVVIDPGHGGEDPGAIGPSGTREKDVVLDVARIFQNCLNKNTGIRAFLTRTGDYYVGLEKRVEIAQDYGADLFISIHADAALNRRLTGASVYCLSLKGATDEAARILAEKENASDFMGGLSLVEDPDVNAILLDLMQTQTINDSLGWGRIALQELKAVQRLRFPTARQAGFRVLKAPDFPSILVEVAYISNPREEKLLGASTFHEQIARALEISTYRFLCQQESIHPNRLELRFCNETRPRTHLVQRGQSLFQIASLYDTTVGEIQKLNRIKDASRIYPGQKLLVP